jgi:hypothetical protein
MIPEKVEDITVPEKVQDIVPPEKSDEGGD